MNFKQRIYNHCLNLVTAKTHAAKTALDEIAASLANETKSTAGDKYETARAMLHIEQENISRQLQSVQEQLNTLEALNIATHTGKITNGSLVITDKSNFFLSVALSKMVVDDTFVIALSPASPLGKKLMGCGTNDSIEMNGVTYLIKEIL